MKVIGINGSPRKGWNTSTMVQRALDGAASQGAETKLINLFDLDCSGCTSCFACKRLGGASFGRCGVHDSLKPLLDEILDEADALVVGAPIYFGDVPGAARNFFERLWFPGLLYSKDGELAYVRRIKVGLIYTMNHGDASAYDGLIGGHKSVCNWLLGETTVVTSVGTMQFDDYSKYASSMFDPAERKQRHEQVFPADCQAAFDLGKSLVG